MSQGPAEGEVLRVGLVSDTHGLLDARLPGLLAGCSLILHAGDVDRPEILHELERIAPVRAVRGNNDHGPSLERLPFIAHVELGQLSAVMIHARGHGAHPGPALRRAIAKHRPQLVVFGHSHRPSAEIVADVLWVNPGSAGPRRFGLPRAAGLLAVRGRSAEVTLHDLLHEGLPPVLPAVRASW